MKRQSSLGGLLAAIARCLLACLVLLACSPVHAAISFQRSSSTDTGGSGSGSLSFSSPSGLAVNDIVIAQIVVRGTPTINAPSGWTLVDSRSDGFFSLTQAIYWKAVGNSGLGTSTWSFSVSSVAILSYMVFRGVDPVVPVNVHSQATALAPLLGSSTSVTAPSLTPTVSGTYLAAFYAVANGSAGFSEPSGMTEREDRKAGSSAGVGASANYQSYSGGTSATGSKTATATALGASVAHMLALWPAGTNTLKADYHFDESTWSGVSGEVVDSSGNAYNATAHDGATTTSATPAYSSSGSSTCSYGLFDRTGTTQTYVELPSSFPSATDNFTAMAWVRSTSAGSQHQRIFVRDDNQDGWALSLADGSGTGLLRFFDRSVNFTSVTGGTGGSISMDTDFHLSSNTWYFVAVSAHLDGKQVTVYVYDTSGTQRAKMVGTYTGTFSPGTGATAIGGETPAGGEGASDTWHFLGNIDEVRVYRGALSQADIETALPRVRSCPSTTASYYLQIQHGSGAGLTCTPSTLTVKSCSDAACATAYTAGVTGTLSATGTPTVNWVSGNSFTIPASSSSTTLDVQVTTAGSVVFGVASATPTSAGASCNFGSPPCTFTAADAGFLFDVPDHRSEAAQTVNISAVKKSDGSLACTPAFASVSKSVTFICAYQNPATGSLPVRVGGSALNASNNVASACDGSGHAVSLSFNASGVASTTVQYADAGALTLSASYASASGSSAGLSMTGSDSFVAAPSSFSFSGTTAGPIIAGKTFSTTVTALNASGNATPNFGRESSPEAVTLSASRYRPTGSGAVDGAFSGSLGSFSSGSASASNLTWSEVGTIDLTASLSDGNYLGSGLNVTGSTSGGAVGRFRPDHFVTTVTPGCGSFTYSAQPMTVIVRAYNGAVSPVLTQNYDGTADTSPNYAKDLTLSAVGGSGGSLSPTAFAATVFDSGSATLTTPTYTFASAAIAPATVHVRATDSDGVSSSGFAEGGSEFRSGRLWLGNGYGSELLDLSLPAQVQYYADATTGWAANSADHCTVLAASQFGFSFPASSSNHLAACETAVSLSGASPDFFLRFSAPGAGNDGFASVTANLGSSGTGTRCTTVGGAGGTAGAASQAWLRYGWGGGAAIDPVAQEVFGIYRSGVIDWRESP
ncbi:LamG domain-containing protein [Methyloterricola oryzae]|uniref:LamG domain-containing protein n=1 Tax=Methyloterricola oryzae TaxID=1495050 RepID=UPI00069A5E0C|nr:LamG domain-containing protein [Methyloterricola oryzae]